MPAPIIPVSATSAALQAAINKFLAVLQSGYTMAKITAMVAAGFTATMATVNYTVKGGGAFFKGSASFTVPGPEVGVGASFLILMVVFALFKAHRMLRYPAA